MFYRSQMISLKCKHLIQSVTGFLIISKSDRTKCHQILAINRITKLNITREYLKLRKRYRKVIIRHFIKDMLLAKRLQLMITSGSFFRSSKSSIRKSLVEDRIGRLVVIIKSSRWFIQSDRSLFPPSGSFFGSMKRIIAASDIIFCNIIQNVRKLSFA